MTINNYISSPFVFQSVQWTGSNLNEVTEVAGEFTVSQNDDGSLTITTPWSVSYAVTQGQWVNSGGVGSNATDPYAVAGYQAVPDAGPLSYTVTG